MITCSRTHCAERHLLLEVEVARGWEGRMEDVGTAMHRATRDSACVLVANILKGTKVHHAKPEALDRLLLVPFAFVLLGVEGAQEWGEMVGE
jgi:hypothetical protein